MLEPKYTLLHEDSIEFLNSTLYRIKALRDFGDVKKGDLGGYIESEANLSHLGNCWVYDNATVLDNAMVYENARVFQDSSIFNNARVFGNAEIWQKAAISGNAKVYENAFISERANVLDNAQVYGNARVYGYSSIKGEARVYHNATVFSNATLIDRADISENHHYITLNYADKKNNTITMFKAYGDIRATEGHFPSSAEKMLYEARQDNDKKKERMIELLTEIARIHILGEEPTNTN